MDPPSHPYYPLTTPIPSYVANESSVLRLLTTFGLMVCVVVGLAYWPTRRSQLQLRALDKFAVMWFALCGFLHVGFEGYYLLHRTNIPGLQTIFGQLWKEYALSDSRYLTADVFTVCVETITVFAWGPLSWTTYFAILTNSPYRHINQVIVSTAHLYGVALYYGTNWGDLHSLGVSYSRPEFQYYWVYYVGLNAPWAVIPFVFLYDSYRQTAKAFRLLQTKESDRKAR
ncbi:uncharacterized protein UV8b_06482 [Ustilaginoidea virens]|uniref:EXPERA domain-containing protein n=1 Tax=Ustilaginoidea virens TaxID=1159556 RepID=A0A063C6J0_USTVR|nr:uncharacterized protein UV8b_06482 [Ustilaginoidea virens]QUC22241.1 hypothetical protein UV8b_06482 [Ustilaginoidea virens]GAO14081.1 hypothetical protein UVI_02038270 [Ustilaginoidea virens]